jgi:hypothetical protein
MKSIGAHPLQPPALGSRVTARLRKLRFRRAACTLPSAGLDGSLDPAGEVLAPVAKTTSVRRQNLLSVTSGTSGDHAAWDHCLDALLEKCQTSSLTDAVESSIHETLGWPIAVFWQPVPRLDYLLSATRRVVAPCTNSLAGFCLTARGTCQIQQAHGHAAFNPAIDTKIVPVLGSTLLFPLIDDDDQVFGIVQLARQEAIVEEDAIFADWFARKLKLLKKWVEVPPECDRFCTSISSRNVLARCADYFDCRVCEVWKMAPGQQIVRFVGGSAVTVDGTDGGIAGESLRTHKAANFANAADGQSFDRAFDTDGESVFCLVIHGEDATYGFVLRGSNHLVFASGDEAKLLRVAPYLLRQFSEKVADETMLGDDGKLLGTPASMALTVDEIATVCSLNCFAPNFKGAGHFKELFFFFESFHLFELFGITAERFYRFLVAVSERYTSAHYHNWTHACDVTQCIFFMIKTSRLDVQYEPWELFIILTAAICHDINHRGLNNVFNMRAETPLGILYKDQSVLEIHHIHESIQIINRDNIQLFGSFDVPQSRSVWQLFIHLILVTDMAKHFDLLKRAEAALAAGTFSMENPEMRRLGLQLVMKVSDISNVCRPFNYASMWCDILNLEFFHQGDLEKELGIGLTSPLNDRETSNKPKSQIGFYNFICIPLYSTIAKLWPPLQVQLDNVLANLQMWKDLAAAS